MVAQAWKAPNGHVMPVSDAFSAACGLLWIASYILLTRQAFKDHSYGMPIYALCLNITCEITWGFVYGIDPFNTILFALWASVDLFLFYATIKYGKHEWRHAPLVADHLALVCVVMSALGMWMQLAFASEAIPVIGRKVVFYSSWPLQIVIGVGSIEQIVSRSSVRGHSLPIWGTRAVGTLCASLCFVYRLVYWPERFAYAGEPVAMLLILASLALDAIYPFIYLAVRRNEELAKSLRGENVKTR